MSEDQNRIQTNRDVHNQYAGQNAYGHIHSQSQTFGELVKSTTRGAEGGDFFSLILRPFTMVLTAIWLILKGVFKIPARFYFFGFVINYLLYKPLTYFFEEYLNRNCPILFDPHFLTHMGTQTLGGSFPLGGLGSYLAGMVGSISAWINFASNLDQGLSLFVLFFATMPWVFGRSVLLGRPALRIYAALNFICLAHLIYKGHLFPALEGNFSTDGATFLMTCLISLCVCLTAYWLNPVLNKAFAANNLNSLGENQGGFVDTLTADNNLKTPIQS